MQTAPFVVSILEMLRNQIARIQQRPDDYATSSKHGLALLHFVPDKPNRAPICKQLRQRRLFGPIIGCFDRNVHYQ